ncbi:uncharacterized protein B0T23DRAFT_148056 [Neurospora hispaniola]|uniref:Uncharacterized protein n=1 Tax=Neurospora hispaniola TaxID=588809 RepID=A0AAJ0I888_9PEZI|nr:hypothetical protein B0T23DRAFT_148056 [Neurospora hispaniola]
MGDALGIFSWGFRRTEVFSTTQTQAGMDLRISTGSSISNCRGLRGPAPAPTVAVEIRLRSATTPFRAPISQAMPYPQATSAPIRPPCPATEVQSLRPTMSGMGSCVQTVIALHEDERRQGTTTVGPLILHHDKCGRVVEICSSQLGLLDPCASRREAMILGAKSRFRSLSLTAKQVSQTLSIISCYYTEQSKTCSLEESSRTPHTSRVCRGGDPSELVIFLGIIRHLGIKRG